MRPALALCTSVTPLFLAAICWSHWPSSATISISISEHPHTGTTSSAVMHKPLVVRGLATSDMEELPPMWVPQESNCVLIDVPVDSPEWRTVADRFHASLKESLFHVIRVERVQVSV